MYLINAPVALNHNGVFCDPIFSRTSWIRIGYQRLCQLIQYVLVAVSRRHQRRGRCGFSCLWSKGCCLWEEGRCCLLNGGYRSCCLWGAVGLMVSRLFP
ncbi:hypothetical protein AAFF_G00051170 [Aldrovandia affinis]|uniref:Uncharacterized protein n=1 Tax=Aldrovandia affinis TaxID=143900 RepID=A0AAD7T5K7_9TELE|nr:hypothetical protein AAFF_G00051170 [Aldrovandia affinis]